MTRKFITVMDMFFNGRTVTWRDENGKPVVFDTREEAQAQIDEYVAMDPANHEPDEIFEVVVTEGSIVGVIDGRTYWIKGEEQ